MAPVELWYSVRRSDEGGNEVHECGAAGEGRRRIHGETDYTHFDQIVQDTIYSD